MTEDPTNPLSDELAAQLREARPQPDSDFTERLDRRVADGFTREGRFGLLGRAARRLRASVAVQRFGILPLGGAAAGLCAVAIALLVALPQLQSGGPKTDSGMSPAVEEAPGVSSQSATSDRFVAPGSSDAAPLADTRRIERSASIVLETDRAQVRDTAAQVLDVASRHDVIVESSTSEVGRRGARARFSLMVPAGNLQTVLTALSGLADVLERRDRSLDITGETVGVKDQVREARADVEGLLGRLAGAGSDQEREQIRGELERAQARLSTRSAELERLRTRAAFASVEVSVVDSQSSGSPGLPDHENGWSLSEAADDALKVLKVSAGVALVTAAASVPIFALVLLGWFVRRAYLARSRQRALGG